MSDDKNSEPLLTDDHIIQLRSDIERVFVPLFRETLKISIESDKFWERYTEKFEDRITQWQIQPGP